jgi:hypothetical protein
MIEDTYLMDWAEELVDTIVTSICDVISKEGVNNPVSVVEREYKRLSPEKQFLLQYMVAVYWGEGHEVMYETLAKQNIVDVWDAMNFVP